MIPMLKNVLRFSLVLGLLLPAAASARRETGTLTGWVRQEDGTALGGIRVVIDEAGLTQVTDAEGRYRFPNLAAGTYTLTFTLGDRVDVDEGVTVNPGTTAEIEHRVDWRVLFAETLIVESASRRPERIVDAPAAVSVVTRTEIERDAAGGQLPKLLEFVPGVEITQGGLYDFNLNTRGFNSTISRRVAVLVDGRDLSMPLLLSQEWGAYSLPFDDLQSLEMVRGPSAALYGANASSGVLNLVTRPPRGSEGGLLRLTAGELSTTNADLRYASQLGSGWYLKVLGGYRRSQSFARSRVGAAEYAVPCAAGQRRDCLPQEAMPLPSDEVEGWSGHLRLDRYVGDKLALTLEGGKATVEGAVNQGNTGRILVARSERPWYRFNLNHPRWNLLLARSERDGRKTTALGSGLAVPVRSERNQAEVQGNWELGRDARLVVGASLREDKVDSFDPERGTQAYLFEPVAADARAAFGQLDWDLSDQLKLVLALRFDTSDTFYDDELSPKAGLVYALTPNHILRLTYNEAFQSPAILELYVQVAIAPPLPLGGFESFCTPYGVDCGFDSGAGTQVMAVGNPELEIEQVESFEMGYSGILAGKAWLTVDYYNTRNKDFISDMIPTQSTPLGNFNQVFGPYAPPAELPAAAAAQLLAALEEALGPSFALLSNNFDGTPILAVLSHAAFGEVDTQGVDVGLHYDLSSHWTLTANYSWFDFDVREEVPGLEALLSPNAPEHAVRAGVSYAGPKFDLSLSGRWVDRFLWVSGPFNGDVESYHTFDLTAGYELSRRVKLRVNVSNLFDQEHYEAFGGDLISRRAVASLELRW